MGDGGFQFNPAAGQSGGGAADPGNSMPGAPFQFWFCDLKPWFLWTHLDRWWCTTPLQNESATKKKKNSVFTTLRRKEEIIPILHWSSSLSIPTEEPKKYSIVLWRFSQWCPIVLCWETFFEPSIWSETKNLCVVCKTFMKPKNCNVFKICNVCDVRRLWKRIKNPRTTTLMLWKNYFWAARVACFTYDYAMESRWKKPN